MIGGRVCDCRIEGERASWTIDDVTLALGEPAQKIVFFNNLEDDTVPLDDRVTTNILGRFAALDIKPGWNRISNCAPIWPRHTSCLGKPFSVRLRFGISFLKIPKTSTFSTWME